MKKSMFLAVLLGLLFVATALAQEPGDTLWTRTYGGTGTEWGTSVQQTSDGGYIITGCTNSFGAGGLDLYLVKTDANGDTLWTRAYGGSDNEKAESVQQTTDGGYIITGYTTSFGAGGYDFYLVKTDANGDTLWTRTYGGYEHDYGWDVQQTSDGGYIVAGYTNSFGAGIRDFYLVKTYPNGDTMWTRTYGGESADYGMSVQQTTDDGYIITGYTYSFGAGRRDIYLVKTDVNGVTLWTRTYGGIETDWGYCVEQTADGGYIIAGYTESFGAGGYDFYLVKTDANGDSLWTCTYGGTDNEYGYCVDQTTDGGYIITGYTESFGAGGRDLYLVKTDANGDTLWTRTHGGIYSDYGACVQQTADGNYIVAGYTESFGAGDFDVYLLRVAGEAPEPDVSIEIIPDDPPVTVPQGGSFGFTGTLTNNTEDPQVIDAWTMAIGPEPQGIRWGPFRRLSDVGLAPQQIRSGHFSQHVPNLAPLGFYDYIAYCGDYPSTLMDSSYFQIEVVEGVGSSQAGWVLTGSFLEGDLADVPSEFALLGNYPNPFNATTLISYELPTAADVKLEVYNLFGQKVATLIDGEQEAGYRSVTWEDSDAASGVYFYKLTAGDFTEVKRMTLLR